LYDKRFVKGIDLAEQPLDEPGPSKKVKLLFNLSCFMQRNTKLTPSCLEERLGRAGEAGRSRIIQTDQAYPTGKLY